MPATGPRCPDPAAEHTTRPPDSKRPHTGPAHGTDHAQSVDPGLSGRQRAGGGAGERARAAVTHRIRGAIRRIADVDPALGQHLLNAVKTGTWCAYQPDTTIEWTVAQDGPR